MRTVTRTHAHASIFSLVHISPANCKYTRGLSLSLSLSLTSGGGGFIDSFVIILSSQQWRSLNCRFCQRRRRLLFVYFVAMRKSCRMLSGLSSLTLSVSGTFEIKPRAPSLFGLWNVDASAFFRSQIITAAWKRAKLTIDVVCYTVFVLDSRYSSIQVMIFIFWVTVFVI